MTIRQKSTISGVPGNLNTVGFAITSTGVVLAINAVTRSTSIFLPNLLENAKEVIMKCDKLIRWQDKDLTEYYEAESVDAAINELKAENEQLKKKLSCIRHLRRQLHDAEMRADLAEAAETERKIDYKELERKFHEANAENRRLKRALYKACANWAYIAVAFFSSYATKERWNKMELKCLKKAEEYR